MTDPKNARSQPGGGRKYVWGHTDRTESFDSVTTILAKVLAKPAIAPWAARTCGEYVRDNMGFLYGCWKNDRDSVVDLIKQAPWKVRDAAADRGTLVHALAEAVTLGQDPTIPPELAGHVASWQAWREDHEVEFLAAEATCYNRYLHYAGTFDAIVEATVRGERQRCLVDYKTGKDVYPEAAFQLTAYRMAEFIGLPDGTEEEMPEVDGTYVLRLSADDYDMVPVKSDDLMRNNWVIMCELYSELGRSDLLGASVGSKLDRRML